MEMSSSLMKKVQSGWSIYIHCYCHDISKDEFKFSKRVQDGGRIMIWIFSCPSGKSNLEFISTSMKSEDYIRLLSRAFIPFVQSKLNSFFNRTIRPSIRQKDSRLVRRERNRGNGMVGKKFRS
jgi:hypothetical protein